MKKQVLVSVDRGETRVALLEVTAQQAFEGCWNLGGWNTITDRTANGSVLANGSPYTEIVCVNHPAIVFNFFSFETDIGDPVLAAAVRAAGHM